MRSEYKFDSHRDIVLAPQERIFRSTTEEHVRAKKKTNNRMTHFIYPRVRPARETYCRSSILTLGENSISLAFLSDVALKSFLPLVSRIKNSSAQFIARARAFVEVIYEPSANSRSQMLTGEEVWLFTRRTRARGGFWWWLPLDLKFSRLRNGWWWCGAISQKRSLMEARAVLCSRFIWSSRRYIYGGSEINIDRGGRPRVNHVSNFEVSRVIFSVNGESAGISIRISFAGAGVCACSCDRKEIR